MHAIPIPKGARKVRLPPRLGLSRQENYIGTVVILPKRVWIGRNMLGMFEELFFSKE